MAWTCTRMLIVCHILCMECLCIYCSDTSHINFLSLTAFTNLLLALYLMVRIFSNTFCADPRLPKFIASKWRHRFFNGQFSRKKQSCSADVHRECCQGHLINFRWFLDLQWSLGQYTSLGVICSCLFLVLNSCPDGLMFQEFESRILKALRPDLQLDPTPMLSRLCEESLSEKVPW